MPNLPNLDTQHVLTMQTHPLSKPANKIRHRHTNFQGWRSGIIFCMALVSAMGANGYAASGGQPFVIRETFEQHAPEQPTSSQSHGVVGMDLLIRNGHYPLVEGVFSGTPAARQGLMVGDVILAVNGVSTLGKNISQVDAMISDVPGDRVTLSVQRGSQLTRINLVVAALEQLPANLRPDFSSLFDN